MFGSAGGRDRDVAAGLAALRRRARLALAGEPGAAEAGAGEPATIARPVAPPELRPVDLATMLEDGAGSRPALLAPVLPAGGLTLVHGPRGVGRSHVLLGCAVALAAGDWFLGWRARRPVDVLYVSGSGSAAMLGGRLAPMLRAVRGRPVPDRRLRLLAPDLQASPMPELDTARGQAQLVPLLGTAEVLVIDDAGVLMPGAADNATRSRERFGSFLRHLARSGRAVLVGQASGAGVTGRGDRAALAELQARADVVIGLQRPADYADRDGARFELSIERASHLPGSARERREIRPMDGNRDPQATRSAIRAVDTARERFLALLADGVPAPQAGREIGLSRTTAWRWSRRQTAEPQPVQAARVTAASGAAPGPQPVDTIAEMPA